MFVPLFANSSVFIGDDSGEEDHESHPKLNYDVEIDGLCYNLNGDEATVTFNKYTRTIEVVGNSYYACGKAERVCPPRASDVDPHGQNMNDPLRQNKIDP